MAYVMPLARPKTLRDGRTVSRILNVSKPVGLGAVNAYGDVLAVQQLLVLATRGNNLTPPPVATGTYDAITGFWIFSFQVTERGVYRGEIIDGLVSPARGGHDMYGPGMWTIIAINGVAMCVSESEWNALLARYDPLPP